MMAWICWSRMTYHCLPTQICFQLYYALDVLVIWPPTACLLRCFQLYNGVDILVTWLATTHLLRFVSCCWMAWTYCQNDLPPPVYSKKIYPYNSLDILVTWPDTARLFKFIFKCIMTWIYLSRDLSPSAYSELFPAVLLYTSLDIMVTWPNTNWSHELLTHFL